MLERMVSDVIAVPRPVARSLSAPGWPLPPPVLHEMEALFGADFSSVRVHVGPQAQALGARAFAMGSHLFFAPGQYDLESPRGRRLLGHELTHVLQQRSGRARGRGDTGLTVVTDPELEAEADWMGERVAACWPTLAHAARGSALRTPPVAAQLGAAAVQADLEAWFPEGVVIQRAPTLLELKTFSTTARTNSGSSVEVQAMSVKDAVVLTANSSVSTDNFHDNMQLLTSDTFLGLVPEGIRTHTGLTKPKELKKALTLELAAEKAFSRGTIILRGGQAELHAEQGLLIVLAHMMKANEPHPLGDVIIGGRNPPCGSCREVLDAFAGAYSNWGYGTLTYDTNKGQERCRARLNLRTLFRSPGWGRFSNFCKQYTRDMT